MKRIVMGWGVKRTAVMLLLLLGGCSRGKPEARHDGTAPSPVMKREETKAPAVKLPIVGPVSPKVVERRAREPVEKGACRDARYRDRYTPGYPPDPEIQKKVAAQMATLSLKEKADQMRGTPKGTREKVNWKDIFRSPDNPGKRIRGFRFRDGPRGVNLDAGCPEGGRCYSTAFPVEIARGAAFDPDLEYRIGRATGDETLAAGHTMMLSPSVNIVRHPAWGRTQESYGEDPFLLGRLASAYITGVQQYVPACVKHFIANNVEVERRRSDAHMDEQTLREVYGAAYEMAIRDGGVACVMASYNRLNGTPVVEHHHALTEILREDFGFRGFVISDWWALANEFDVALDPALYEAPAKRSLEAGVDMEMPWALNYEHLESLVKKRVLDPALINAAAGRILTQKHRFNIADIDAAPGLERPVTRLGDDGSIEGNEAHLDLAYEAAVESAVLLKNEAGTLPIDKEKVKTVAVLGAVVPYEQRKWASKPSGKIDFARDVTLGDWGSSRVNADPKKSIGPFEGIRRAAGPSVRVVAGEDPQLAKDADFVVVVAGLTPGDEGEEYTGAGDRKAFGLDAKIEGAPQNELIRKTAALKKPMAVVLVGGSVIDMPWLEEVPAVVMSWYPGIHGGRALGDLLFGHRNFSGKLPLTWPNTWDELPTFDPGIPAPVPMGYFLGYRYYDKEKLTPRFPFGHGLGYSRFSYHNLEVPCGTVTKNGVVEVKVDVVNEGKVSGEEVVFLFVAFPDTTARRPVKELKGFSRVALSPGEAKQVTLPLRIASLKFWNSEDNQWEIASGRVKIMVGGSADRLPLNDIVIIE